MVRTRLRSGNSAAWTLVASFAALASLASLATHAPATQAQVLMNRHPGRTECPDSHLRLTARHPDGSPAAALRPQDLYLWFSLGSAEIESMQSGGSASNPGKMDNPDTPGTPDTNVLIVVRPQAVVDTGAMDAVQRSLRAALNTHWKLAVLAPDGSVSPFLAATDATALHASLTHAVAPDPVSGLNTRRIADWAAAERIAFRRLQARSGRHVIIELAQPGPDSPYGDAFAQDRTLDLMARDDMTQIYRLAANGKEQVEASGGRTAPTIDALFHDIASDAPGSYDLVVHPLFSCEPGASYSLRITSFQPNLQLFYPSAIRMAKAASPH
jgi:hypothetical protein